MKMKPHTHGWWTAAEWTNVIAAGNRLKQKRPLLTQADLWQMAQAGLPRERRRQLGSKDLQFCLLV